MNASTEAEFMQGIGNPNIIEIVVATDIVFSANCTVAGVPIGKIYELTRNVTITVPVAFQSTSAWYPTLDFTVVMTPKIRVPRGLMLSYEDVMFAHIGPYRSFSVGDTGFSMPYLDANSTGLLKLTDSVVFIPFCASTDVAFRLWQTTPRPPSVPGYQRLAVLPTGWCAVPYPEEEYAGQCFANAYRMVDIAWASKDLVPTVSNPTNLMTLMTLHYVNTVVLCNQLASVDKTLPLPPSSGLPLPPALPSQPASPHPSTHIANSSPAVDTGAVVGAALGSAALVVILAAGFAYWRSRRRPPAAGSSVTHSSWDAAERRDDDVRKEQDQFANVLEQLKSQVRGRQCTIIVDGAPEAGPPRAPSSGGNDEAHGTESRANGTLETGSADSHGVSPTPPDMIDELHEMSRSMQTSICDQQLHIQAVIGSGAFGTVYRGSWQGLPVAIKTLMFSSHTLGGAGGQSHSVLTEAALSKSISHPNVVATYNCDLQRVPADRSCGHTLSIQDSGDVVNDWRLYIIQEFCDGGSLFAALRKASAAKGLLPAARVPSPAASVTFDMETVFELAFDISCGMSHLHERNVVHGDLNPANVLLKRRDNGRWTPKVCDFGFSVHLPANKSHVSNTRRGTPFYVAPEVMQCGKMSRAADVFAMGVMLWEMYMGHTVWQESDSGGPALHAAFPHLPNDAPPIYAALVLDCTCFDALQRPTFLGIMERLLELKNGMPSKMCGSSSMIKPAPGTGALAGPRVSTPPVALPTVMCRVVSANAPPAAISMDMQSELDDDQEDERSPSPPLVCRSDAASPAQLPLEEGNQYDAIRHTGMSVLFGDDAVLLLGAAAMPSLPPPAAAVSPPAAAAAACVSPPAAAVLQPAAASPPAAAAALPPAAAVVMPPEGARAEPPDTLSSS